VATEPRDIPSDFGGRREGRMATEKIAVDDVEYEEYDGEIDEAPGGDPDRDCIGESEEKEKSGTS
jgi:hypothetical protein